MMMMHNYKIVIFLLQEARSAVRVLVIQLSPPHSLTTTITILHRALTQGPPKMLGGKILSQAELQEKWLSDEAHAKRNQLIADFQKKERRREYQRQDKARQEGEIQEKKSRAREISNKQEIIEKDRTVAHTIVMTQRRLERFDSNPMYLLPILLYIV